MVENVPDSGFPERKRPTQSVLDSALVMLGFDSTDAINCCRKCVWIPARELAITYRDFGDLLFQG